VAQEIRMSTAPAAAAAPPPKGGKKKLIIIILIVTLLLLALAGGAAFFLLKKKASNGDDAAGGHGAAKEEVAAQRKNDPDHPPIFVSLDPFTVNLADRETERYAQIGIVLQITEAHTSDELKLYMPAIRNNILMVLANRTATQLLTREGKEKLAQAILYASVRPLGFDVPEDGDSEAEAVEAEDPPKKKKRKRAPPTLPVTAVHFSNFIIQ
jgi:flagellar FliL protein